MVMRTGNCRVTGRSLRRARRNSLMPWPMCFSGSVKKVVMVTEKACVWGKGMLTIELTVAPVSGWVFCLNHSYMYILFFFQNKNRFIFLLGGQ